ncbi:unnamed protein product [Didymodactylos carnosus]|uniref:Uncharacterized protein n=1 Tax=Didymodactylos carnosus TaxID=1234261 RepID=A0A8S2E420_9BILA|nr:unnamed protein product [Didymodactylos carnosus]CAF3843951.1 unnamed protein product [Didymodactylos carnosus]
MEVYTLTSSKDENKIPVLFEYEMIDTVSAYVYRPETNTIIFDLGVTFLVSTFEFDENKKIWIVKIKLTDSTNIKSSYLAERYEMMGKKTNPILLGEELLMLGYVLKAEKYFNQLKNEDNALIYYHRGEISYKRGNYDEALDYFFISYELMIKKEQLPRMKDTSLILQYIGSIYGVKRNLSEALKYHRKALAIQEEYFSPDNVEIGISYYNIGRTLHMSGDYDEALTFHQKARAIWDQKLPYEHILIAQSLESHGLICCHKKDYTQSLIFYMKALQLYEIISPNNAELITHIKKMLRTIEHLLDSA